MNEQKPLSVIEGGRRADVERIAAQLRGIELALQRIRVELANTRKAKRKSNADWAWIVVTALSVGAVLMLTGCATAVPSSSAAEQSTLVCRDLGGGGRAPQSSTSDQVCREVRR